MTAFHTIALRPVSPFEHVVYQDEDVFEWSDQRRNEFQRKYIAEAFTWHFERNSQYRSYCEALGVRSSNVSSLSSIPLLPAAAFKAGLLPSAPENEIVKPCTSSGTRGSRSVVPRDELTLERLLASVQKGCDHLLHLRPDAQLFVLGPDTEEAGDLWISYVLSIVDLIFPTWFAVKDGIFLANELAAQLQTTAQNPVIVGPPFLVMAFLEHLEASGQHLDLGSRRGTIITAGGWKQHQNRSLSPREFIQRVSSGFSLGESAQVRDTLNLVELNTVLFDCEKHSKHIPPWLHVRILDPETLIDVKLGSEGLIAYLDATATSYPCFFISDDFGYLPTASCTCGRASPTVVITRRVSKLEQRGCALKMSQNIKATAN